MQDKSHKGAKRFLTDELRQPRQLMWMTALTLGCFLAWASWAEIDEVNRRNKYFQDAQAELSKVQEDLLGVEQSLAQRRDVLEQTELRAPVRGVVKNVRITTQGGVIRAGEEVMQIVPLEDDLLIEAKLRPADIAFIKPGLEARVKIDAYDYTIYGDLPGKLDFISADTLTEDLKQGEQPYYRMNEPPSSRPPVKAASPWKVASPAVSLTKPSSGDPDVAE